MCRKTIGMAGLVAALAAVVGGCGFWPGTERAGVAGERQLTPDGSTEAHVKSAEHLNWSLADLSRFFRMDERVWVYWGAPGSASSNCRRVQAAKVAPDDRSTINPAAYDTHLLFSGDSRRLAVVSHVDLKVVDLVTGAHTILTPPNERVTSAAWVAPGELVYASHTYTWPPRRDDARETVSERTFWRQDADSGPGGRRLVYRESSVAAGAGRQVAWPLESFSPTGRHVIFRSPAQNGSFVLLDMTTRAARSFGACSPRSNVWWSPDGARAICSQAIPDKFVLVDARTGRATDVSESVAAVIQRERRWRNDTTFENYLEIQGDAARAVLAASSPLASPLSRR